MLLDFSVTSDENEIVVVSHCHLSQLSHRDGCTIVSRGKFVLKMSSRMDSLGKSLLQVPLK